MLRETIIREMGRQGFSQREMARRTDVSPALVNRFLAGTDIRLMSAQKFCDVLGLKLVKSRKR